MLVVQGYKNVPAEARGASIAIGNFDGVHRGHQALLRSAVAFPSTFPAASSPKAIPWLQPAQARSTNWSSTSATRQAGARSKAPFVV